MFYGMSYRGYIEGKILSHKLVILDFCLNAF